MTPPHDAEILWDDGEFVLSRETATTGPPRLVVTPSQARPARSTWQKLEHAYGLRDELDGAWATRPLEFVAASGRLTIEHPGGTLLARDLGSPWQMPVFLRVAVGLAVALRGLHRRGWIHRDLKPASVFADLATGRAWLSGFGLASRVRHPRQAGHPPQIVAGTLAYMAPEQTGRMNRSIDSRSDLYACGVTFYEMLTGSLPFTASEPMEWIHCHIARQPPPPDERVNGISKIVAAIVMKLLAKNAEDRYQTAAGLEADLRRCLGDWDERGAIDPFPLGARDVPDRLQIPERLYGRERVVGSLLAAFERVVADGTPALVLVSGYSGIGKSAVVNELHKALVPPRGLFASAKFDRYERNTPYATLARALRHLTEHILTQSETDLGRWRDAIQRAVGSHGRLMVDLIPELELIIGGQPPVTPLPPRDAQFRFQLVLRRFVATFARPEHPLALFLDDLQWLDSATLDLLPQLVTDEEVGPLLLVGAYRDNEVGPSHPFRQTLDAMRAARAPLHEIVVEPLGLSDVRGLVADAVCSDPERALPLAQLVHVQTAGNPFFIVQFLTLLADEGLLTFDAETMTWTWDLERITSKGYTDNVVELLIGKLTRLAETTQWALQHLACLGNSASVRSLSVVFGVPEERVETLLQEAESAGLILRTEQAYSFLHNRVQEAAYALVPEDRRSTLHLRIGRQLASGIPEEQRDQAAAFEIVNQLNRGAALIVSPAERGKVAELNLEAARRAKSAAAYASALSYLVAGEALLAEEPWEARGALRFALALQRAECEIQTGDLGAAEQRLAMLSARADTRVDRAAVVCLQALLYMTLARPDQAVERCLDYLRATGIDWTAHPAEAAVRAECGRLWQRLGDRPIESLLHLPLMSDPDQRATMDVLAAMAPAATLTDENLPDLACVRMANLSIEHGNVDGSCYAYSMLNAVIGLRFGDYGSGYRFGQLSVDLVEQVGLDRFKARVYSTFGHMILPWTRAVRASRPWSRRAFEAALESGDFIFWVYCCQNQINERLISGDPLDEVQRETETGLAFARKVRFGLGVAILVGQLLFVRMLRGLAAEVLLADGERVDEESFERRLESNPLHVLPAGRYWIRKLQARFHVGDYTGALEAARKAQRYRRMAPGGLAMADYEFYAALAWAGACPIGPSDEHRQHLEAVTAHHAQLATWAANCPENFADRAVLVEAEIARLEGRELDAERSYEQAIRLASERGFVQNEGLANELAAQFHRGRGLDTIARAYLRNARYCYERWGAHGKVQQLDQLHPDLQRDAAVPQLAHTIGAPMDQLDLATVVKASQAVSGEIVLGRLIEKLMTIALEHAGAGRALLVLRRGAELRIEAEARSTDGGIGVRLAARAPTAADLPDSVLQYVLRTQEAVLIGDASAKNPFSGDDYLARAGARSVLCVPLVRHASLAGALYLENTVAAHAFTAERVTVLELLAAQAAISLENTRLYGDLQEREARIRRLVDANIIGIMIWGVDGRIIEANDAFLTMVGYSRDDLVSGLMRWTDMTPAEWHADDQRRLANLKATGRAEAVEKEYFRRDGSRVPVLVGAVSFEGARNEGVAFVLDLTERKRSEEALRRVQAELAHVTRVTTLGELTGSIAHEINQPLGAVVNNASACLRWLAAHNLEEARQSMVRVVADGHRASEIIGRIRALARKAPPRRDWVDVNDTLREVLVLAQSEVHAHRVSVRTRLVDGLPAVWGDRIQLQQVMLNLLVNALEAVSGVGDGPREVWVETARGEPADLVTVTVRDSGPGLDPTSPDRLFDAFYTTKPAGLGMGLAISRSIVESHGGRLWATPNAPRGAVFQFTLPTAAEGAA